MSNNLSINTRKVSNNYKEAREELKEVLNSLLKHGLTWSDQLEKEDLIILTSTAMTFIPLINSAYKLFINDFSKINLNNFNTQLIRFCFSTFLLSHIIFKKSVFVAIYNIFKSAKSMLLIIPESCFIETEDKIINRFNSVIENGANINKDSISELVITELVNDIIKNENL